MKSSRAIAKKEFNNRFVHEDVSQVYNIGKDIGYGRYGVVRLVASKSYDRKDLHLRASLEKE
jgi:hypothetical protein